MIDLRASTIKGQIKEISDELANSAEHLKGLTKAVSIFGSARTKPDNIYYTKTLEISRGLAQAGFSIISGGGPGIMEAANKGCHEVGGTSVGLLIKLPFETKDNTYQSHSVSFKYFMSRKTTFFMNSWAYIVMPGGFGTLDELFETLTLIQTHKANKVPVILVGKEFWTDLIQFFKKGLLANGYISSEDLDLYTITDDPIEVVTLVQKAYEENAHQPHKLGLC